jgi:hypothetical protein
MNKEDLFLDDIVRVPSPIHSSIPGTRAPREEIDESMPSEEAYDLFDEMMNLV